MKKTSTKVNLFYNMLYQLLITILPLITVPYVSRVIGSKGVGIFSYYSSISLYFVYFSMLGILNYGNRQIAKCSNKDEVSKTFSNIYIVQVIVSILFLIIYIGYLIFFPSENKIIPMILILHVLSSLFDVSWLFFGLQDFKLTALRQIFIRILSFISIYVFVKTADDLWIYTLIMGLSYFVAPLILWIIMLRKIKLVKPNLEEIKKHIKPIIVLFIPIIATSIYRVFDKIMIGKICTMEDVAYYESADKMVHISLGIISSFGAVMMPKISNLLAQDKLKEAKKIFDNSLEYAMCIGIAIFFGISSVSKEFIPLFFGSDFSSSIILSMILSVSIPIITWASMIRLLYLIPTEKDKVYVRSVVIGAIINFIANLILIHSFGTIGAVVGTILAEGFVAVYQSVYSRNDINIKKGLRYSLIFTLFGVIMFLAVRMSAMLINNISVFSLIIEIFVGASIYLILSFIYFYLTKNEILMGVIKRKVLYEKN